MGLPCDLLPSIVWIFSFATEGFGFFFFFLNMDRFEEIEKIGLHQQLAFSVEFQLFNDFVSKF